MKIFHKYRGFWGFYLKSLKTTPNSLLNRGPIVPQNPKGGLPLFLSDFGLFSKNREDPDEPGTYIGSTCNFVTIYIEK